MNDLQNTYLRLREISDMDEYKKKNDKKVSILVPPSPFIVPNGWEFVHKAPFEGPSIIAAILKGLGYEVEILDQRDEIDPENLLNGKFDGSDIVFITTYEDSFPYIKRAVEIAKNLIATRPVVLGGPLVSSVPEVVINNTEADYAVIGEGELTLIELMDYLEQNEYAKMLNEIDGLGWKSDAGKIQINKPRKQMDDLDAVPVQELSVWPHIMKTGIANEIYMTSSRGCPGNCSFCYRTMEKLKYKSLERVRKELKALKKYRYKFVWWSDLTFIDSKKRIQKLLDIAFTGLEFRWSCFTRVDGINLEILKHMKEHGCDIVMYGFESITEEILDYFNKRVSEHQIIKAIELTKEADLKIGGLFIVGGPGETKESLKRLIEFTSKFKDITRVKYMSAIPGTKLYYDSIKKGLIKDELEHLYFLSRERSREDDEIINFTELNEKELRNAYKKVNLQIKKRPYEYWNKNNRVLEQPEDFKDRSIIMPS